MISEVVYSYDYFLKKEYMDMRRHYNRFSDFYSCLVEYLNFYLKIKIVTLRAD